MTVQELIDELEKIEDRSIPVLHYYDSMWYNAKLTRNGFTEYYYSEEAIRVHDKELPIDYVTI